ncbi:MAG: ribokinase [Alphaproteobacteria bacterium]|nr:ribokinase [Alphaproteobacteria bacterium]
MIIVFGSINMDMNIKVRHFPEEGETILSNSYTSTPGGKGANQALAAARIGAKTALVGKVGDDGPGLRILNYLKRHEVMTSGVAKTPEWPTGMAVVMKTKSGKNRIVVASGANAIVGADQAPADIFHDKNILLTQMEVPLEQNAIVMKAAHDKGAQVVLNLAPALNVPKELLSLVDFLIVNQIEARQLAEKLKINIDDKIDGGAEKLATALAKSGKLTCIITLGEAGVVAVSPDGKGYKVEAMKLGEKVVDTTGAGDCFCGTFTACLHEKKPLADCLRMATIASGLSCQKEGTTEAYPYLADIEEILEEFPLAKAV